MAGQRKVSLRIDHAPLYLHVSKVDQSKVVVIRVTLDDLELTIVTDPEGKGAERLAEALRVGVLTIPFTKED